MIMFSNLGDLNKGIAKGIKCTSRQIHSENKDVILFGMVIIYSTY